MGNCVTLDGNTSDYGEEQYSGFSEVNESDYEELRAFGSVEMFSALGAEVNAIVITSGMSQTSILTELLWQG